MLKQQQAQRQQPRELMARGQLLHHAAEGPGEGQDQTQHAAPGAYMERLQAVVEGLMQAGGIILL
jgi:hypothetical protein